MNTKAAVFLDVRRNVGQVDRRVFGGFLEHLGRAVYDGIYDPGNPLSDESGFRLDVIEALKHMRMPLVRYPGGSFVSNYDWRDGMGPKEQRPRRPDFAWKTVESNQFGVDEFIAWCRKVDTAPFMVVNLGTLRAQDAAELVEYCNLPEGTFWADRRAADGHPKPHAVPLWGLGNEMDGFWQAGHVPAEVYALRARQAAQLMKGLDPGIELVASGSTVPFTPMPTYMEWDRIVLEQCWDQVDYISTHHYTGDHAGDTRRSLAEGVALDGILEDYAALLRYVRAVKKSSKSVYVAFDEWNVWYRTVGQERAWGRNTTSLFEESYDLKDALVVAQYLSSFIRHADTVKIACLSEIVNAISPVLTRPDRVLLQTTYFPFVLFSSHARGLSLVPIVDAPLYEAGDMGNVPLVDCAATCAEEEKRGAVFLVNRDLERGFMVEVNWNGPPIAEIIVVSVLSGYDPCAANTWESPDAVQPMPGAARVVDNTRILVEAPAMSLTVVEFSVRSRSGD
jgi:alpha-N-arabinofuranosidase